MAVSLTQLVQDFGTAVTLGAIRNTNGNAYQRRIPYGFNPSVQATPEGLWSVGGPFNFITAPEPVRVAAGGNAADDAVGAGARSVRVLGLDSNLLEVSEVIPTAGVAAGAPSSTLFWRVTDAIVEDVGTYGGGNAADMVIEGATTLVPLIGIVRSQSKAHHGAYAVPIDHTALVYGATIYVERSAEINFELFVRENLADAITPPFSAAAMIRNFDNVSSGVWSVDARTPTPIPGGSDIYVNVATVGAETHPASASFEVILIPNK